MTINPLHILLIEAEDEAIQLISQTLAEIDFIHQITLVTHRAAALDHLTRDQFDAILLTDHLVDTNGLDIMRQIKAQNLEPITIFMAGAENEHAVGEALQMGAGSYIIKDIAGAYARLLPTLIRTKQDNFQPTAKNGQYQNQLDALREASTALTSTLDLTSVLENILIYLEKVVPYDSARVFLFEGEHLVAVTGRGFPNTRQLIRRRYPADAPLVCEMARTKQAIVLTDAQQDDRFHIESWGNFSYIRGWMGVPLIVRDKNIGYLTLDSKEVGKYGETESGLAQAFANQAAVAIENGRLFDETKQRAEQLQTLHQISQDLTALRDLDTLLQLIVERAVQFFRGEAGGIYLYRPERDLLEWVVGVGTNTRDAISRTLAINEGLSGQVWAAGKPLLVNNYQGWPGRLSKWPDLPQAIIGAPIQWGEEFLGVLNIRMTNTEHRFTDQDTTLLSQFASQAAVAIRNARLFAETHQRAEQLAVLHQASLELTSSLELHPVLEAILENILKFLPETHNAHIFLYDKDILTFGAAWARGYRTQAVSQPRPNGLTYTIARQGKALIVPDVRTHPLFANLPPNPDLQGSIAGLPLKLGQRIVGVMNVFYPKARAWPESELRMLYLLADQAAIAIENTRLYQKQHASRRESQALHRAALALVSTINMDEVIQRILIELQEVVPYDSASVQLLRGNYTEIIDGRGFPDLSDIIGFRFDLSHEQNALNKTVIETKRPLIVDDTNLYPRHFRIEPHNIVATQSWLAVPMLVGEHILGLITLDKLQTNFYREKHIHLASAYAAQAAIAIQNAQLHQSTTDSLTQLTRLYELSNQFVSTLSLDDVANLVIEKVVQATNAHSAVLHLIDDNGHLELTIGADEPPPRPDGTTMTIFNNGQLLVFDEESPASKDLPHHLGEIGIMASIGLPLKAREKIIGVLFVRHDHSHRFTKQETETLFIFANQAAIAIQNARLYEQAQQEIFERMRAEAKLNDYRDRLEVLVQRRTVQLERALAEIAKSKDKIDAILRSVADGLIVTDPNHKVVLANPAAEALLEYRLEAMMSEHVDPVIKNDWLRQLVHSTLKHRVAVAEVDVKLETPDGERPKIMHARTALVDDHQGDPLGAVTIIRDVTRLREVDRLKTEFLSIAAHELRTPLTTVLGFSEILLSRQLDESRRQRYITLINEQASQLTEIVNNLLDISRLEAGKGLEMNMQPLDMGLLLREVAEPFIEANSKHQFRFEGLAGLPLVQGDRFRLRQVGKNLLSNAVKYSPSGGKITIRSLMKAGHIEFSVQDEGIGLTPEQQEYLFEKFYRADATNTAIGGTGLGLAISKLIIDLHYSLIWVESQRNVGTTVYFTLPIAAIPTPGAQTKSSTPYPV